MDGHEHEELSDEALDRRSKPRSASIRLRSSWRESGANRREPALERVVRGRSWRGPGAVVAVASAVIVWPCCEQPPAERDAVVATAGSRKQPMRRLNRVAAAGGSS